MKRSAEGFTRIAREVFAPIYPVIAEQVLAWSGIRDGICLDLGSGPGLLSVALARTSSLSLIALDADPAMARIARETAAGSPGRVTPVTGDVHCMPIRDNAVSLIVSRGSIYFCGVEGAELEHRRCEWQSVRAPSARREVIAAPLRSFTFTPRGAALSSWGSL